MRTPLAWNNLVHNKVRTGAAVAGVMFAVVLIFLQLGFLGATEQTASLVYGNLDCDLLVRSQLARRLAQSKPFPRSRLDAAAAVAGVRAIYPLYVGFSRWRIPRGTNAGQGRRMMTLGVRPGDPIFLSPEMQAKTALVTEPQFALVDRMSRAEFGPRNGRRFSDDDLGGENEIGGHRVRLVGHYALGASFDADGSLILSDDGFFRLYPGFSSDMVSLGLVKLQGPHVDAREVARQIRAILPPDVEVLPKVDVIARERHMWLWEMSIGLVFVMGVAVAMVVGTAVVYQILSSDVASHLSEYATLKAMGYRNGFLGRVVIQQALILSLCGFLPGLLAAAGLYSLTQLVTNIPIAMTFPRIVLVAVLSVTMCGISGLAALCKLRSAAPADLFV